jgi:hypothetical protein
MDLRRLESLCCELDKELDLLVDAADRWLDVPPHFTDREYPDGFVDGRMEFECGYCGALFWPIEWTGYVEGSWFYYQAGYWFGDGGNSYHFPVCSDGCHDALERQLEKRMHHTKAQMETIGRARRLIKECRATAKRIRAEAKMGQR